MGLQQQYKLLYFTHSYVHASMQPILLENTAKWLIFCVLNSNNERQALDMLIGDGQ